MNESIFFCPNVVENRRRTNFICSMQDQEPVVSEVAPAKFNTVLCSFRSGIICIVNLKCLGQAMAASENKTSSPIPRSLKDCGGNQGDFFGSINVGDLGSSRNPSNSSWPASSIQFLEALRGHTVTAIRHCNVSNGFYVGTDSGTVTFFSVRKVMKVSNA